MMALPVDRGCGSASTSYVGRLERIHLSGLSKPPSSCRHRLHCHRGKADANVNKSAGRSKREKSVACRADGSAQSARQPVAQSSTAFAPATIANLGPGFDWLGCAVEVIVQRCPMVLLPNPTSSIVWPHARRLLQGEGDLVTARVLEGRPGEVQIEGIEGDGGRLSLVATDNCVGIAAIETVKLLGSISCGVSLRLKKVRPSPSTRDQNLRQFSCDT